MIQCPSCKNLYDSKSDSCTSCDFKVDTSLGYKRWSPLEAVSGDGFDSSMFDFLAAHEPKNFWFKSRNKLIMWLLKKYASPFHKYMEIGCGTGFVLQGVSKSFPAAELVGSEYFDDGLKHTAKRVPEAELIQMDARKIPYKDEFEVITALDVIEHIAEDEDSLRNIHDALIPGGHMLLTVPQHQWLWSPADDHACHVRRYNRKELVSKVEKQGFTVLRTGSFVTFLLPLMMISRALASKEKFDPLSEFKINPLVNKVLELILGLERLFIKSGINFGLGGSRFLLAVKTK